MELHIPGSFCLRVGHGRVGSAALRPRQPTRSAAFLCPWWAGVAALLVPPYEVLLLTLVCVATGGVARDVRGADETVPSDSPYLAPEMRELMAAVTLHVSFDRQSMTPDMAEGPAWAPQVSTGGQQGAKGPQFAPGLLGNALVLGSASAIYPRAGNVLLEKRGALALWIKPENWQRPNDGNCVFAMTTDAAFYLQRQGPLLGEDGKVRRHEVIQYLVRDEGRQLAGAADWTAWTNGQWYLLVANWSWPTFELSVNGGPFSGTSLRGVPGKDVFGDLIVGYSGGDSRGLLDELMAFRRPLSMEEVKLVYRLLVPAADAQKRRAEPAR